MPASTGGIICIGFIISQITFFNHHSGPPALDRNSVDDSPRSAKLAVDMNLKRWFAWTCLLLVVVAEVALFRAYRDRDEMQTDLRATQSQMHLMQDELDALRNSDAGLQAAEILRLRKQNQILTNQVAQWRTELDEANTENQSNAQHLATARVALRLQQDHLDELQNENRQVLDASVAIIARKTCINNLRLIDDAKQQWAVDLAQPDTAMPTVKDLQPYFKDGGFPECPEGGIYTLNAVNQVPTCSIPGHTLPQ
jgi:hypothetical protein